MLDQLKKFVGKDSAEAVTALQTELETTLAANQTLVADLSTAQTAIAELTEKLSGAEQLVAELTAKLDELNASLASAAAEKAQMVLDQRKEKLVAVIGTVRAEAAFAAVAGLNDEAFDAVLTAMTASAEAESASFQEQGVDPVQENLPTTSLERQKLEQKYGTQN